jgi:choline kinase
VSERTLLILAAGRGTRLEPLTRDLPKCMVPLHGRPLVAWQVDAARAAGVERIVLATGYMAEALAPLGLEGGHNPAFATTNMVESLHCARELCRGEVIVSYGDIVYRPQVLEAVLAHPGERVVAVDSLWLPYWQARVDDPLDDCESLRMEEDGRLTSVGQKVASVDEVQGQYIGLTRWSPDAWADLLALYAAARAGERANPWPREVQSWYFTDLLQTLIDEGRPVFGQRIDGDWLEIDTPSDLALAERVTQATDGLLAIDRSPLG